MLTLIIVASLLAFFFVVSNLVWFFFCKHTSELLEITDKSFTQSVRDSFDEKVKLSRKNDILMVENDELRKKIETSQTKVDCQENFVRGSNMGYEALSTCNPSLFKPDFPTSTTVVVEEVEEEVKNDLKLT